MRSIVPGTPYDACAVALMRPASLASILALYTPNPPAVAVQAGVYIPIPASNEALNGKVDRSERGAANGVASLDNTGKVPSNQLPPIPTVLPEGDGVLVSINGERDFSRQLPSAAFPVAASDADIPLNGTARVGRTLRYRPPSGPVEQMGDFNTVNAQVQDALNQLTAGLPDIARAGAAADKIGATGLVYINTDPDGTANLLVLGTSSGATLTYANEAVPLAGTISVPTLVIA